MIMSESIGESNVLNWTKIDKVLEFSILSSMLSFYSTINLLSSHFSVQIFYRSPMRRSFTQGYSIALLGPESKVCN